MPSSWVAADLEFGDLIVLGSARVGAFGGLRVASNGFRVPLQKGSDDVVLLGTALAFVSIVLAIATARGMAELLTSRLGWVPAGAICASSSSRSWKTRIMLPNGCKNVAADVPAPGRVRLMSESALPPRLYFMPRTRSSRGIVAAREIGEPYELTEIASTERRSSEHLHRHPLGRARPRA